MFTSIEHLRSEIHNYKLDRLEENIVRLAKPAILISRETVYEDNLAIGASKFGGRPDLPAGFEWPYRGSKPLTFMGQFKFSEIAPRDKTGILPKNGILFYFYDAEEMTWGSRDEIDGWHVFYIEDENTPLNRTTHPTYQGKWWLIDAFPAHRLDFSSRLSLPRVFLIDCMEYELDFVITGTEPYTEAQELHAYWKMCDANYPGPRHHFLGHSVLWQDKVEREVVINSQGIETQQDPETKLYSYSKEQLERIESEINKWQFLFQIDSDFTTLGETGSIYICIPKTSLAARNFADCWTILQCT